MFNIRFLEKAVFSEETAKTVSGRPGKGGILHKKLI